MVHYEMRKFVAPSSFSALALRHCAGFYARTWAHVASSPSPTLAVTASGLAESTGQPDEPGLPSIVFDGITPNPKDHEIMVGAARYRDEGCDVIIAPAAAASSTAPRASVLAFANGGHILDYEGVDRIPDSGPAADLHSDHGRHLADISCNLRSSTTTTANDFHHQQERGARRGAGRPGNPQTTHACLPDGLQLAWMH